MLRFTSKAAVVLTLGIALGGCTVKPEEPAGAAGAPAAVPPPPDVAAAPADAVATPSGLKSKILRVGVSNVKPTARSTVRVHYTGWTTDGQMFDSSVASGQPIEFPLDQVIPGWTEGLQLMVVGEKRRFWIPGMLAYDGIPNARPDSPKGMLVFDIELLAVK
jgi:FKBP-type peptidyl-prolyl cis-trans isomerase